MTPADLPPRGAALRLPARVHGDLHVGRRRRRTRPPAGAADRPRHRAAHGAGHVRAGPGPVHALDPRGRLRAAPRRPPPRDRAGRLPPGGADLGRAVRLADPPPHPQGSTATSRTPTTTPGAPPRDARARRSGSHPSGSTRGPPACSAPSAPSRWWSATSAPSSPRASPSPRASSARRPRSRAAPSPRSAWACCSRSVLVALADRRGRRLLLLVLGRRGLPHGRGRARCRRTCGCSGSRRRCRAASPPRRCCCSPSSRPRRCPRGARAYAVSVMTLTAALGAGMCVWFLPLADTGINGWRILYVIPLAGPPRGRCGRRSTCRRRCASSGHTAGRGADRARSPLVAARHRAVLRQPVRGAGVAAPEPVPRAPSGASTPPTSPSSRWRRARPRGSA